MLKHIHVRKTRTSQSHPFDSTFFFGGSKLSSSSRIFFRQVHPYFQQPELLEFCRQKNLQVHAFSPLAHGELGLLEDRLLTLGYASYARWGVQQNGFRKKLNHNYIQLLLPNMGVK